MDWNGIKQCSTSFEGKESMFQVGLTTQYVGVSGVPYIVIDGIHNDDSVSDFTNEVCKAYKGYQRISSCVQ